MTKVCPHCWRNIRIRKDGTFSRHSKLSCDGSFKPWKREPKLLTWPYPKNRAEVRCGNGAHYYHVLSYVHIGSDLMAYCSGFLGVAFIPVDKLKIEIL